MLLCAIAGLFEAGIRIGGSRQFRVPVRFGASGKTLAAASGTQSKYGLGIADVDAGVAQFSGRAILPPFSSQHQSLRRDPD